jgi:hypothetical protein
LLKLQSMKAIESVKDLNDMKLLNEQNRRRAKQIGEFIARRALGGRNSLDTKAKVCSRPQCRRMLTAYSDMS